MSLKRKAAQSYHLQPPSAQTSQVGLAVKNPPANAGYRRHSGLIPGSGRAPGGEHGNHSSILAWETPWTKKLGELQSMGQQELDMTEQLSMHACIKYGSYPSISQPILLSSPTPYTFTYNIIIQCQCLLNHLLSLFARKWGLLFQQICIFLI